MKLVDKVNDLDVKKKVDENVRSFKDFVAGIADYHKEEFEGVADESDLWSLWQDSEDELFDMFIKELKKKGIKVNK